MASTTLQREKAQMCAIKARAEAEIKRPGIKTLFFEGPAQIRFEVRRVRLLDDDNVVASLKHYRDGITKVLLPRGDGPNTPYTWAGCVQIRVASKTDEGVFVEIEEPEPGDPPSRPFSGTPPS